MKIILLMGVIGSGKDYYAEQYITQHPKEVVLIRKFATPLKLLVNATVSENLLDLETYEQWKLHLPNREKLVKLAIELKDLFHKRILTQATINLLKQDLEDFDYWQPNLTIIFTDCRLLHEIEEIHKLAEDLQASFEIILCNYKSTRYQIIPFHPTEKFAIKLLDDFKNDLDPYNGPLNITQFVLTNCINNPKYEFD